MLSHTEVPLQQGKEKSFIAGVGWGQEVERAMVNEESLAFHGPGQARRGIFLFWGGLLLMKGVSVPPFGPLTLF